MNRKTPSHDTRRILLLVAAALCALAAGFFLAQERHAGLVLVAADRLGALLLAAGVCALATSGGLGILARLGCEPDSAAARFSFGLGAGLGFASLAVLLLGMAGLMQTWVLAGVLVLWGALGLRPARRLVGDVVWMFRAREGGRFSWTGVVWSVLAVLLAMNIARAFEPPWEYDTLEYHLGAPAIWHEEGRVSFLRDNVYSNMPLNTEMLYLLGMRLRGDRVGGAQLGFLFNVAMAFAGALAIRAALARLHSETAGDAAAAIYYAWPGVALYGGTGHVEIAQQFYGVLALCAFAFFVEKKLNPPAPQRRARLAASWLAVASAMAGFAIGVKYPSALFVLAPIVGMAALAAWVRDRSAREASVAAIFTFAVAIAVASPWLIRNAVNTGNPTYPLLHSVFGGRNWTALQEARWQSRHSPGPMTAAEFVRKTQEFFTAPEDRTESALLFAFLPLLLLVDRRRLPLALALLGYAAFCVLGWFLFTHRADRFLAPAIPAFAALGGVGVASLGTDRGRGVALAALLAVALFGPGAWQRYLWFERALGSKLGEPPAVFFATKAPQFRVGFRAMQFINDPQNVPPDARIVFFPEARTFWCEREVIAPTPFDRSLMEETAAAAQSPGDIAASLREVGATHLLVNYSEIGRLVNTGDFVYEGRQRKHRLDRFDWQLFQAFLSRHTELVEGFGDDPERPAIQIYRLTP